jgi:GT2 family glycosyltransferase
MAKDGDTEKGDRSWRPTRVALWQPGAEMAERNPLIVAVAYRNTESLGETLRLLERGSDVLVVDNGVAEEVRRTAERHGAEYVTFGRNLGFASAVNVGLSRREGRHVLLLNPDARISPGTLDRLVATLQADPRLCAVAPSLVDESGSPQRVEWPIPSPRVELVKAFRLQRILRLRETFLIGAVLLLRSEAIAEVGRFDERFFLYAEECDWQLRALRQGWQTRLVDDLQATHSGGGSSSDPSVREGYFYESAALFGLKWYGPRGWATMRAASAIGSALRLAANLPLATRRRRYAREFRL